MRTRRSVLGLAAATALAGCSTGRTLTGGDQSGGASGTTTTTTTNAETSTGGQTSQTAGGHDVPVHASDARTGFGIDLAGAPIVGHPDAALDLYYWGDYQCPFCGQFEADTLPRLLENEIGNGTVRLPLLAFPNIGDASLLAASYSRAVWLTVRQQQPSAFYRWHAAVFDAQGQPNSGWATRDALHAIARDTSGVDAAAVESRYEDERSILEQAVRDEKKMGVAHGVSVTPTFVVYDPEADESARIKGAQPYARFQSTIEDLR